MPEISFTKMHGTGNDFIMIENFDGKISLTEKEVSELCDRHFGIGADGVILLESSKHGWDCFMNYINSDGSFAEMCGNGVRCTADYLFRYKNFSSPIVQLETRAGMKKVERLENHTYRVNMGEPVFPPHKDFLHRMFPHQNIDWHSVSMGNPHAIGLYESEEMVDRDFESVGAFLEQHTDVYPNKVNVTFVYKKGDKHFGARTYERGCGPTLACGTAASGTYAVLSQLGLTDGKTRIDVPGGTLHFEHTNEGEILLSGPSAVSFSGTVRV